MDFDEKTKHAWRRFCNGFKLDGTQHALVMRLVRDLRTELHIAEQAIHDLKKQLENKC
jgi:hypothetical protein